METFRTKRITAPATMAVPLQDLKDYFRVDEDDENALIKSLGMAATEYVERYTRRSIITQTWALYLDRFPGCDYVYLPHGPVTAISSINYKDSAGGTQTVSSSTYSLDRNEEADQRVYLLDGEVWPSDEALQEDVVAITYVAGYGDEESVPEDIKTAVKLIANHWFENRESVVVGTSASQIPMSAKSILDGRRLYTV